VRREGLSIVVVGVGGQGVVFCSRLIAETAVRKGVHAVMSEVHGMSQRGGIVESSVVLGKDNCPMVSKGGADLLLATEPLEALRALSYLSQDGVVVTSLSPLVPYSCVTKPSSYPSREEMIRVMKSHVGKVFAIDPGLGAPGKRLFINVALVGGALRHNLLPFLKEDVEQALRNLVEPKQFQPNLASLGFGYESVMEL